MTEETSVDQRNTTEAREALRRVQELGRTINGLAGRVGRTAHETRDRAAATNAAMERIDVVLGEGVEITRSTDRDISTAGAVLDTIARLSLEADARTAESRRAVEDLAAASREVERIIAGISAVARQTRLLALNAMIEAVHAGAHGQGFNVVATEVRRLASQTADFAGEIGGILGGIQKGIDDVAGSMRALGESIGQVSGVVGELRTVNESVGDANRRMGDAIRRSAEDAERGRETAAGLVETAEDNSRLIGELERNANELTWRGERMTSRVEALLTDFVPLTILEWEGYFSRFSTEFEAHARERGMEVRLVPATDDDDAPVHIQGPRDMMATLERGGVDVVAPTHSYFGMDPRLFELTEPLDTAEISHWEEVLPSLRDARWVKRNGETHASPLLCGSVALGYNAKLVDRAPESWKCLLDPRFKGRIGITDGQWETNVYIAALIAGVPSVEMYDPPPDRDAAIQEALNGMVDNAGYFWGGQPESSAMRELALVTDYWPGIAAANAEGQDWRFASPREGQPVWFDCMAITREAARDERKRKAAYLLLDFMLSPEIQKRVLETVGTSIVSTKAGGALPPDVARRFHIGDNAFFRPEHLFQPLKPATRARFEKFWRVARSRGAGALRAAAD